MKIEWRTQFTKRNQELGLSLLERGRVIGLKEDEKEYKATVLDGVSRDVRIIYRDGKLIRMVCGCPKSAGGTPCQHMAAVLLAQEQKEAGMMPGNQTAQETEPDGRSGAGNVITEENAASAGEAAVEKGLKEVTGKAQEDVPKTEPSAAEAPAKPVRRKRRTKAEMERDRLLEAEAKAKKAEEKARKKQETEQRAAETEQKEEELRRAAEQERAEAERREVRRKEREERKAERARKQEEARLQAQALKQKELERQQAEERRRQEIRQKKEEEKQRKLAEAERQRKLQEEAEKKKKQMEEREKKRQEKLKAAEERRQREQAEWEEKRRKQKEEAASRYQYFNTDAILKSMKITPEQLREGQKLLESGKVEPTTMSTANFDQKGEPVTEIRGNGHSGRQNFPLRLLFSRDKVLIQNCQCPDCRYDYYGQYASECRCKYMAAMACFLEQYGQKHALGDATNQAGMSLLGLIRRERVEQTGIEDVVSENLRLVPRLQRKDGELQLSFRVGADKLFVVKNLPEFCGNVRRGSTDLYGSKTYINHRIDHFDEESRQWIHFLEALCEEDEEQRNIFHEKNYYDPPKLIGQTVRLYGWRLDRFYQVWETAAIEYEDKETGDRRNVKKAVRSPRAKLLISGYKKKNDPVLHGITAKGNLPEFYYGADGLYYIDGADFCRTEDGYRNTVRSLKSILSSDGFSVRIGRNNLADFYYKVLPELEKVFDVEEKNAEQIHAYLPPQAQYAFYLDADEDDIFCRAVSCYGEKQYNLLDLMKAGQLLLIDQQRDVDGEQAVLAAVSRWLPEQDMKKEIFYCSRDEDKMFQLLSEGVEELEKIGEVHATQSFRSRQTVRTVKLSVGVTLSGGLLDLQVTSEDLSREELLDILAGYRQKKRYYRLKSGAFMDVSQSSSVEMLSELMETMHLSPKELLLEHMELPVYRTLYLDKLLEEHEEIYSRRDSHFRSLVKGFKTVSDADFEVPESLDKIMRNYQKKGYQWLRTLETWGFGGILADDMGLGKTLQTIAVLLAAKQEGKKGTSLVTAPASLVFNWGEELRRFAPELKIMLISGTQVERQAQIEAYEDADVLVTSYDLLKRDIVYYEGKEFLYEIIDEAQYIKNHTTAAAKAVKVIRSKVRFALTGTPIENRLSELWSIFDYLMPGFLYGYDTFRKEIELPAVKHQDEAVMKRLQKLSGPFILRRLKEQVLKDLPDKLEESRYVEFEPEQRTLYDGQLTHMREMLAMQDASEFNKNRMQILAELTRLRQICCDPSLCFENYRGAAAKTEACMELIESAIDGGHKILVFSQFTSMLDILKTRLGAAGIAYYTITGETKKEQRLEYVKRFNGDDTPVFLISLKAGGVGLNLTGADVVIHYDPWWNLAVQNQATDRAHRIGQTRKVTVYKMIVKGSIEEKIQELQEKKRNLAEQVIGGETGQLSSMTREDILAMLE